MKERRIAQLLIGGITIGLGLLVSLSWFIGAAPGVQWLLGTGSMVFNASFCFTLAGAALVIDLSGRERIRSAALSVIALILLTINTAVFVENVYELPFQIDWPALHRWLDDGSIHPGRMAPNTALGFIAAGLFLWLCRGNRGAATSLLLQTLAVFVLLNGLTGLIGYWLKLEVLYNWFSVARMTVPTAIGMLTLGSGLWLSGRRHADSTGDRLNPEARILVTGSAILVISVLIAGLAGFVLLQHGIEKSVAEALVRTLDTKLSTLRILASRHAALTQRLARNQTMGEAALDISRQTNADAAIERLYARLSDTIALDFRGMAILSPSGTTLYQHGRIGRPTSMRTPLNKAGSVYLDWDGIHVLGATAPILDDSGRVVAIVVLERAGLELVQLFFTPATHARSGEMLLCRLHSDRMYCFPQYQEPRPSVSAHRNRENRRYPISYAAAGQRGVRFAVDYRGQRVLVAYAPVHEGVGMVVKQDTAESLTPIADRFLPVLALLLLSIGLGSFLLYYHVAPLLRRLVHSEESSRRDREALSAALSDLDRTAQSLRRSEQQARSIVDTALDAFVAIDQDGRVIGWNRQAQTLFGWSFDDVNGRPLDELIIPERFRSAHKLGIARFINTRHAMRLGQRLELVAQRKDGTELPVELTVSAQETTEGYTFNAFLHDISERKHHERTLAEARDAAEAASRAKSAFLANMSHEIRTPLNGVLGLAHLIGTEPLSRQQREYLNMLDDTGRSLLSLLNSILDLSKIEAEKMELLPAPFALSDMVDSVATAMAVNARGKDIDLIVHEPAQPNVELIGDAMRLKQLLLILLDNAVKFTDRGFVALKVEAARADATRTRVLFRVSDSGIGIGASEQERLFRPFVQADASTTRRFGGSGLGLVIAQRLARLMGGEIEIDSEPGRGSTFRLTLAFPHCEAAAPAPAARPSSVAILHPDAKALDALSDAVRAAGARAECYSTAIEFMRRLKPDRAECRNAFLLIVDESILLHTAPAQLTAWKTLCPALRLIAAVRLASLAAAEATFGDLAVDRFLSKPLTRVRLKNLLDEFDRLPTSSGEKPADRRNPMRPSLAGRCILLAEDNRINQVITQRLLEKAGADVDIADDGQAALERLRQGHRYDLILMDVHMPRLDGLMTTQAIRGELRLGVPIIALSAGTFSNEAQACFEAGMNDFVGKPVDIAQLFDAIERHLEPGTRSLDQT